MATSAYSEIMHAVRDQEPLIQCLTNGVVMDITANVILAIGASPAMCDTPTEAGDFAQVASGVLINAGTPSNEQYAGMRAAVAGANEAGTPWVLDPVACGGLKERTRFQRSLIADKPHAIRGNASEIIALANLDENAGGGRGVDSADATEAAIPAAQNLAERTGGVVGISGATDIVVSEGRITRITGGDPLMQKVIGTGCSLGAAVAAYLSVG
ncbi:hydroxyethylthiazole kinase, partial [uncultured Corynebacterium sp.]|uniref:hydroxyethylthiazole kinase n=1 Tax=uncultured Corynebacterium sp. TaxID=159447 RepID=UPI00262B57FC